MRTKIKLFVAAVTAALTFATGLAINDASPVHAAGGACYGTAAPSILDSAGHVLYGRGGKCTVLSSPWLLWRVTMQCTNGTGKVSAWYAPTNTYKGFIYCPYPSVPASWGWGFSN